MASKEELQELENLTNQLTTSLTGYRNEINFLKSKIEELQKKEKETEDELKNLQASSADQQKKLDAQKTTVTGALQKLREAKEETVKLDAQILVVKDLFK